MLRQDSQIRTERGVAIGKECCRCPEGMVHLLDRKVTEYTKCGEITGFLTAYGESLIEVEETDPRLDLTIFQ